MKSSIVSQEPANRMKKTFFLTLLLFGVLLEKSVAMSQMLRMFGTPIVANDRLFFDEFSIDPHRIICVSSKDGQKLWEITNSLPMRACFMLQQQLVVTVGANIYLCEKESGKLKLVYQTGYDANDCPWLLQHNDLILGGGINYLLCLDPSTWIKKWQLTNTSIIHDLSARDDLLLCQEAVWDQRGNGSYTYTPQAITAVSVVDGKTMWRISDENGNSHGATCGNYFVIHDFNSATCVKKLDGSTVKKIELPDLAFPVVKDNRMLVQVLDEVASEKSFAASLKRKDNKFPPLKHNYYSFSVPDFKRRKISAKDWYQARYPVEKAYASTMAKLLEDYVQQAWNGIHAGYIYLSTEEPETERIVIYKINAKNGRREKLYEEAIPVRWLWKDLKK